MEDISKIAILSLILKATKAALLKSNGASSNEIAVLAATLRSPHASSAEKITAANRLRVMAGLSQKIKLIGEPGSSKSKTLPRSSKNQPAAEMVSATGAAGAAESATPSAQSMQPSAVKQKPESLSIPSSDEPKISTPAKPPEKSIIPPMPQDWESHVKNFRAANRHDDADKLEQAWKDHHASLTQSIKTA